MADKINVPAGFGGLMRFREEYESRLKIKPSHVVIFIIAVIVLVTALRIFWPISA